MMKLKMIAVQTLAALGMATFALPASASLAVTGAYSNAALSVDGYAGNTAATGSLQADVPAGSTVLEAYLYSASVWGGSLYSVTFGGQTLAVGDGTLLSPDVNPANTNRYDVTSIVKPVIDGGTGGVYNFSILENGYLDGEVLVVVYRNASTTGSAIIMDGELSTGGDTTTLNFASPYAGGDVIMSLASSFSYNGNSTLNATGQVTTIDVTTSSTEARRLTGCAGGNDDGGFIADNGALMTVGGVGDNPNNPDPACADAAGDDELYNLALGNSADSKPFLNLGDTSVTFTTRNPTNDDNVFGLFFTTSFAVSRVNDQDLPPTNDVPEPGSIALLGLGLAALGRMRRKTQSS